MSIPVPSLNSNDNGVVVPAISLNGVHGDDGQVNGVEADHIAPSAADQQAAFLRALLEPPVGCVEIRVLEGNVDPRSGFVVPHETFKSTVSCWIDQVDSLVAEAKRIKGISAYVTVNPVDRALLARADRLGKARSTTLDDNIVCLRWLFLDFDVKRPKGISSTEGELLAARSRLNDFLADHPAITPSAMWGCSGNGYWLIVRLPDYPNDVQHRGLIGRVTDFLSARYSDDKVELDPTMKNPARVMPLVGTLKTKGVNTSQRPHRVVTLDVSPAKECVPFDLAGFAADNLPAMPEPTPKATADDATRYSVVTHGPDPIERARRYVFASGFPDSIEGQRGHARLFHVACVLIDGFGLTERQALPILRDWNVAKAQPPEDEKQLTHKLADAIKKHPNASLKLLNASAKSNTKAKPQAESALSSNGTGHSTASSVGNPTGSKSQRPQILITTEEHAVVDQAVDVLKAEDNLFQRGGSLVAIRAECKPQPKQRRIARPAGSLRIVSLPNAQIRRLLTVHAEWFKHRRSRNGNVEVIPAHVPMFAVEAAATLGEWSGIRPLEGIIETPTLRPDGSLLDQHGYDPDTGLWFAPSGDFPPIPDKPSLADAQKAVGALLTIVDDFPFAAPEYATTWVAALLTALARFAIEGCCPLFLFDANCPGTGKSKLSDIIAVLATGREMPRGTYPDDQDEMQKMLLSVAMAGDRLLLFDNVPTGFSIGGSALDRAVTARTMKGRILGRSEMTAELPMNVVFFVTGNNLGVKGDALRRIVPCRLETTEERPEERSSFAISTCVCGCQGNLLTHVKLHRGELVASALTVIRGYVVAGKPDQHLTPMDFPEWSSLIRSAVKWATALDPCEGRRSLIANDEDTNARRAVVKGWEGLCGDLNHSALSIADGLAELEKGLPTYAALRAVLCEWSKDGSLPSPKTIGRRFTEYKARPVDGKALRSQISGGIMRWYVKAV